MIYNARRIPMNKKKTAQNPYNSFIIDSSFTSSSENATV